MTYIEQYYKWLCENPKKANKKIVATYKMLVDRLHQEQVVEYLNKTTGELEKKTYIFNHEKAKRPIVFVEKYCKNSKGKWAGKTLQLELYQKAMIEALFGFVEKDTELRKYKKCIFFVAKKNGKSTLASALALYGLTSDFEGGAEIYSIAKIKEQAKIVWTEAKHMVAHSPMLKKRLRMTVQGIYYDDKDSVFQALASETNSLDGKNTHMCFADEVWAWEDMGLLDIMQDGMSNREQPIMFETSTMGTVRNKVFDQEYEYCEKVIKGYQKQEGGVVDETLLPIIYELDDEKEWKDEECWYKANPCLNVTKGLDYMRERVQKAQNDPTYLVNLLCKDFNIRQTAYSSWLSYEDLNNEETNDMRDLYCIGGVDLSAVCDLTSATLLAYKNGNILVKQMYFIPASLLEEKTKVDKIPYDKWYANGWLRLSGDSKIDYSDVTQWFVEQVEQYGLRPLYIGYDNWGSQYWKDEMAAYGFKMETVIQGAKTFSAPMKMLKADLKDKKINYNNNPILKWCLSNVSVKVDINENIQPVKEKSTQRIDGFVSLLDAYVVYCNHKDEYINYVS